MQDKESEGDLPENLRGRGRGVREISATPGGNVLQRNPESGLHFGCGSPHNTCVSGYWTREDEAGHQRVLRRLREMTVDEAFAVAVRAGIYTPEGELTAPYRSDDEDDDSRPASTEP